MQHDNTAAAMHPAESPDADDEDAPGNARRVNLKDLVSAGQKLRDTCHGRALGRPSVWVPCFGAVAVAPRFELGGTRRRQACTRRRCRSRRQKQHSATQTVPRQLGKDVSSRPLQTHQLARIQSARPRLLHHASARHPPPARPRQPRVAALDALRRAVGLLCRPLDVSPRLSVGILHVLCGRLKLSRS